MSNRLGGLRVPSQEAWFYSGPLVQARYDHAISRSFHKRLSLFPNGPDTNLPRINLVFFRAAFMKAPDKAICPENYVRVRMSSAQ
jgi:hypothetical protein